MTTKHSAWTSGDAFGNAEFADQGQIRFSKGAINRNGEVARLLLVQRKGRTEPALLLKSVVEGGPDNVGIYLAPADYERLKEPDSTDDHISLEFHDAGRVKAITHPSNRGALGDALVTFVSALALAGCALANVIFSQKADTSPAIFWIALAVLVLTVLAGIWKVSRDIGKLYK
ncbi:hypothetical protein [Mycobacterium sp. OTB74]|jgi:hypothetical protein|uniref:hypothetical protein n=1 Tax=Mycobacterium sp. OTB74 TaxID=1853452 RepID=UPI002475FBC6|nr:hypothetical protein [Mycobacterium sp. OTB74]MDH6247756.1 hypothetical protein [Mycobacterium sp. OTB74]